MSYHTVEPMSRRYKIESGLYARFAFPNPWGDEGAFCIPIAFSHLAGHSQRDVIVAHAAQAQVAPRYSGGQLLSKFGYGALDLAPDFRSWCDIYGLKSDTRVSFYGRSAVEQDYAGSLRTSAARRPTVAQFCAEMGARGRWVVTYHIRGSYHAIAVISGAAYGQFRPRARVLWAQKVTK